MLFGSSKFTRVFLWIAYYCRFYRYNSILFCWQL